MIEDAVFPPMCIFVNFVQHKMAVLMCSCFVSWIYMAIFVPIQYCFCYDGSQCTLIYGMVIPQRCSFYSGLLWLAGVFGGSILILGFFPISVNDVMELWLGLC